MPDYNLGRAHGKIVIDTDTKGIGKGEASLSSFEKTVQKLQAVIERFDRVLDKLEAQLDDVAGAAKRADAALDGLDDKYVSVHKSTTEATHSQRDFSRGLEDHIRLARTMIAIGKPLYNTYAHVSDSLKAFNNANGIRQYMAATNKATGFTRGLHAATALLAGRLIGVNKAYADFSDRQNSILRTAGKFTAVAAGFGVINRLGPGIARFARSLSVVNSSAGLLGTYLPRLGRGLTDTGNRMRTVYQASNRLANSLNTVAGGVVRTMVGFGIARQGIQGFRNSISLLTKGMGAAVTGVTLLAQGSGALGATLQIAGKTLSAFSNAINVVWNSGKQLAGGFLALPGIIGTVVGAFLPLKASLAQIGTLFGDVWKNADDPQKLAKAIQALPKEFQAIGERIGKLKGEIGEIANLSVKSFIGQDAVKEIDTLVNAFKGPVVKNLQLGNNAARQFRQELVGVLSDGKNITQINTVFQSSRKFIDNMRQALDPFLSGMFQLAAVGSQFFASWTTGASTLATRWQQWIAQAAQTGKLRAYMDNAVVGVKDLIKGSISLGSALGKILTMFSTTPKGGNALDKFAASMKKFNDAVDKSQASGFMRSISEAVRNTGTDKIKQFVDFIKDIKGAISDLYQAAAPVFKAFSQAFTATLATSVKIGAEALAAFMQAFQPFASIAGILAGALAGFKLFSVIASPILRATQAIIGLRIAYGGLMAAFKGGVVANIAGLFATFVPGFASMAAAVSNVTGKVGKLVAVMKTIGKIGGAGVLAGFAIFEGMQAAQDQIKDFDKTLQEGKKNVQDYKEALHDAFVADSGAVGKGVLDTVKNQITDMRSQIDKVAGTDIGAWANLKDLWFGGGGAGDAVGSGHGFLSWAQSNDFDNIQKATQDAQHAQKQFDELGMTSKDLANIVTGTDEQFARFNQTLRDSNKNDAANALEAQRKVFSDMKADFDTASPGSIDLANAIKALGDAGSDTSAKINALNSALKALGLDKGDEIAGAFAYSKALRAMGEEAANAVDSSQSLADVFGPDGKLNTNSVNAENLFRTVQNAMEQFKQAAAKPGADVGAEFQKLIDNVPKLAQAFTESGGDVQKTIQNIMGLVQQLGGNENTIKLLMTVSGEDKVKADIAKLILNANNPNAMGEIKVPISANKDQLQKELDSILGSGTAAVGENTVTISGVKMTPDVISKLQAAIPGLQVPGAPPPKPAEIAVQPKPAPGQPNAPPGAPAGAPAAPAAPPAPPVDTTQLDAANEKIKQLEETIKTLQTQKTAIEIDVAKLDEAKAKLDELKAKLDSFTAKPIETTIIIKGYDESIAVINRVKDAVQQFIAKAAEIPGPFVAAFGAIQGQLNALVSTAGAQGAAFVSALAAGITAASGAAFQAAEALAAGIKARFHQSPPKKGPLSAHGDAARYAGGAFVDAYAAGMNGNPAGISAANSFAGGVSQAAQGPYDLGKLLGVINDFTSIGSKMADLFGQIADNIFQFAKFISDPLGKGTFFGKSAGAAFGFRRDPNVSDADLQAQRDERLQQDLQQNKKDEKALSPEQQKQADQQKADAEKQNEITSKLLDEVIAGKRIASPTDEQIAADKQAAKDKKKQDKADTEQAKKDGKATTQTGQVRAKSDLDFAKTAQQAGADLSKKLDSLTPEQLAKVQSGDITIKTQEQMLAEMVKQTPLLQKAIDVSKDYNASQEDAISSLTTVQGLIDNLGEATTPAAKQQKQALESIQGQIKTNNGLTEGANPIDQASQIAGGAANLAKDVFASIESVMESVGAAKNLGDQLVRGFENSEDVMKAIDNVQTFISTAAQIASAVSSGLGVAAGIAGAAASDPSGGGAAAAGALSGASQIASLVSGALSAINGTIDLAQEIYRTAGKYFGEFLGFLTGGMGGQLMGDVRFLLDQNDGSLKTWSRDNPEDKRVFDNPFQAGGIKEQQPQIGQINVYGGPGQDPRDMTNEMMFAVAAAGNGAGNYN